MATHCNHCEERFTASGPASEALAAPGYCVDCYTNGYGESDADRAEDAAKAQKPEVRSVVCLSTAHIPEKLAALKYGPAHETLMDRISFMRNEYGWLVWTGGISGTEASDEGRYMVLLAPTDKVLFKAVDRILLWAAKAGYSYVHFDCDGPEDEQFPTFKW